MTPEQKPSQCEYSFKKKSSEANLQRELDVSNNSESDNKQCDIDCNVIRNVQTQEIYKRSLTSEDGG